MSSDTKNRQLEIVIYIYFNFIYFYFNSNIYYVYQVFSKISAAHKGKVMLHHSVQGASNIAVESYINGTTYVLKFTVNLFITRAKDSNLN